MNRKEIYSGDMHWIRLSEGADLQQDHVNTIVNLWVLQNWRIP
jgi:hypothetical protein